MAVLRDEKAKFGKDLLNANQTKKELENRLEEKNQLIEEMQAKMDSKQVNTYSFLNFFWISPWAFFLFLPDFLDFSWKSTSLTATSGQNRHNGRISIQLVRILTSMDRFPTNGWKSMHWMEIPPRRGLNSNQNVSEYLDWIPTKLEAKIGL